MPLLIYPLRVWESLGSSIGTKFINLYCVGSESMNGFKSNTEKWTGRYSSGKNAVYVKRLKTVDVAEIGS
jgi:hypothetical protein